MRTLIAARVSQLKGDEASRVERDTAELRKWAELSDRTVVEVAADRGVSGAKSPFKRPALGPWLTDKAMMSRYDEIAVSSLDRLGRNARDLMEVRDWATKNGKRLYVQKQNLVWPTTQPIEELMWNLLGAIAQLERDMIAERYAAVRETIRDNGALHGKPTFGFLVEGDKYQKTLVPDPALAPTLREMVDRALNDESFVSIARWLTESGVPTVHEREHWSSKAVAQVLRNPVLKGRRTDASGKVVMRHEGIMSSAEWSALQKRVKADSSRKGPAPREDAALSPNTLRCGYCGGPMYLKDSRTTTGILHYYRCGGREAVPSRCTLGVPQERMEAFVDALFAPSVDGYVSAFGGIEIVEQRTIPGTGHEDEVMELEAEIRELDLDDPEYDERSKELRQARATLLALPSEPDRVEERPTGERASELWARLSPSERRTYLDSTDLRIEVMKTADIEGQTDSALGDKVAFVTGNPTTVVETFRLAV